MRYFIIFLTLPTIILSGCASKKLIADPTLIRPYSEEAQKEEPYSSPYLTEFLTGQKKLIFLANDHTSSINSSTHKTIEKAINDFNPQFLILEGFDTNEGINPLFYQKKSETCKVTDSTNCNEVRYAAYLAIKSKISFCGGEPSEKEVIDEMLQHKRSIHDYMGLSIVRMISQWKRQDRSSKDLKQLITDYISGFDPSLFKSSIVNYESFLSWYQNFTKKKFSFESINNEDTAPFASPLATPLQNLAAEGDIAREQHLQKVIQEKVNQYDRVLVVYGAGHLVKHRPALEKMFREHKDIKYDLD